MSSIELMEQLKHRLKVTEDFTTLNSMRNIPVFFYGDFRRYRKFGQYMHPYPYLGEACTMTSTYRVMRQNEVPMAYISANGVSNAYSSFGLTGDVYLLDALAIHFIDNYLYHRLARHAKYSSHGFKREAVSVWLESQGKHEFMNNVFMYTTTELNYGSYVPSMLIDDYRFQHGQNKYKTVG